MRAEEAGTHVVATGLERHRLSSCGIGYRLLVVIHAVVVHIDLKLADPTAVPDLRFDLNRAGGEIDLLFQGLVLADLKVLQPSYGLIARPGKITFAS